jgi:1-acyl-sn-glycerol-3-phosphate acyltransferase
VLARYHRHRILHLDRLLHLLHARRRVVVVGNHALDVVDPLLFVATLLERYGRVPRFMSHTSWQRLPGLRAIADRYRLVPSRSMEDASRALAEDGFLMLFPGGVSEAALRSYRDEPYRLKWENRLGFLRLALEHDADIVFVATVGNDEMYFQSTLTTPPRPHSPASRTRVTGGDTRELPPLRPAQGAPLPGVVPPLSRCRCN